MQNVVKSWQNHLESLHKVRYWTELEEVAKVLDGEIPRAEAVIRMAQEEADEAEASTVLDWAEVALKKGKLRLAKAELTILKATIELKRAEAEVKRGESNLKYPLE